MVGVANSNSLVTASTDGKLCSWSLDMLTEPTQVVTLCLLKHDVLKVMELEYSKSSSGTKAASLPVSPICFDFQVVLVSPICFDLQVVFATPYNMYN